MGLRGVGAGAAGGAEVNSGANWEPAAAEVPLRREGFVPKTNGGEDTAEVAAAGAMEEREPGDAAELMAAEEEDPCSAMVRALVSDTKLERIVSVLDLILLHSTGYTRERS